jgi:hypothetical protein
MGTFDNGLEEVDIVAMAYANGILLAHTDFVFLSQVDCTLGTTLVSLVIILYTNIPDVDLSFTSWTEYSPILHCQFWKCLCLLV